MIEPKTCRIEGCDHPAMRESDRCADCFGEMESSPLRRPLRVIVDDEWRGIQGLALEDDEV